MASGIAGTIRRLALSGLLALGGALFALPALAGLAVSMSIQTGYPNPIFLGDITAYKISLTNSNVATSVTGVAFTDTLPAAIVVAGSGVASYVCTDGSGNSVVPTGTLTATVGSGTISLTGGTVPVAALSSGSCDIVVQVTSRSPAAQGTAPINTIPAGAVTGTDNTGTVSNTGPAQQSITINTLNNPTITKSFSPTTIVRNDQVTTLTITISNANNATRNLPLDTAADTPAYAVRDVLPASLQVAATPGATSSCTGAGVAPAFSPNAGDTTLIAVGGTVDAGGTCTLQVNVVGTTTGGNYSSSFANTISHTADFGDERGLVPSSDATASLTVTSALQIAKSFSPTTVAAGQSATLTITLRNASSLNQLTGVQLTENNIKTSGSGAGVLTITNATLSGCGSANIDDTVNGNKGFALGSVTPATIATNSSCVITITYTASLAVPGTPETFTDTIPQGAVTTSDPTIISQPATQSVTVVDQLTVSKSANPTTVAPGNPVQYIITVNNYSNNALANVRVTDALPAGMIALSSSPAAPSVSGIGCGALTTDIPALPATTSTPHFTIATVPAGAGPNPGVCTIQYWAMAPSSGTGTITNTIPAGGVCDSNGSGGTCNYSASNGASSTLSSVLTVSKAFNPTNAPEGTVSLLTVTFTNLSAQPMTGAGFNDALPVGSTGLQLVVATPANASSTCGGASISATPGASSVSLSGATIPARANNGTGASGTCIFTVNVIGAAGNYTNTLGTGALTATETLANTTTRTASSPGPISANIVYTSSLTATKFFSPSIIEAGGKSTVTIRLGNVGAGTLNNVSVIDPLPTSMTLANPTNAHTTCGGGASITATSGAATATITGAVIPASGQCDFVFDVIGTSGSNWVNTIPTGNITATGGVQNITPVTATLTNNTTGGLTVTNSTSPNSLTAPGQTSVLTISLNNTGALPLTNLSLTDYFTTDGTSGGTLSGLLIAATPGASTTCSGGTVSAVGGGTSVSLSNASIAAGASCTITVNVTLRTVGTFQNIIPANAIVTAQGITNALPTTTSLSALANIGVIKQFIPPTIIPGQRAQLLLTFLNPLALPVTNFAVTDNLPTGLIVPPGPNASTTCSGATVSAPTSGSIAISNGNLAGATGGVSTTCVVQIDVEAPSQGEYTNVIPASTITSTEGGSPATNPVSSSATLYALNPVVIAKAFSPSQVIPGATSVLTITLNNSNNIALTAAAFADNLPANVAVAPTPGVVTTCGGVVNAAASATSISLAGGVIPAASSCQIQVNIVSNISGVYTNTIPAAQLTTAEGASNTNPASGTLTVSNPPTVTKQFNPAVIPAGGTSTLTITLGNTNTSAVTLSSVLTDTLPTAPGNMVIATPPGVLATCSGSITATAGTGTVSYASGTTIPVNGCTISVNVTAAVGGTYNNTIAAGALKTNLGNNLQAANASLIVSTQGFISGKVFEDNNVTPNGTFESGTDTPLGGVTVQLLDSTSAVIATTTTDINGNYLFSGLVAGTYSVREPTQPAGTVNGITSAGSIVGSGGGHSGTATAITTTPSLISGIVLGGTMQIDGSPGNNFAEVVQSSIVGTIFQDQNNDGLQEGGDTGIGAIVVNLTGTDVNGNAVSLTTTTDASGNYSFTALNPGTYSLTEPTQPAGTSNGITTPGAVANGGHAGTATGVATVPSRISTIVLPPNTLATGNNFAEVPDGGTISGEVFLDHNNNGVFASPPDHGIAGQTINLTGTDIDSNPVSRSTTTAADGSYSFTGLAPGTYTVTEPAQPAGTTNGITSAGSTGGTATPVSTTPSAISAILLSTPNTISANNNFAEVPGIAPDLAIAKTHSPANFGQGSSTGYYTITPSNVGLAATSGVITIADTVPAGITPTSASGTGWSCVVSGQTVTCSSSTAIGAGATGNAIIMHVTVGNGLAGQIIVNTAVIAGGSEPAGFNGNNTASDPTDISTTASIQGTVWIDANYNEILDAGETRVAGWTVQLLLNGVQVASTTTDTSGAYVFNGVAPGSGYQILFRDPGSGAVYGKAVPNESGTTYTPGVVSAANPAGANNTNGTLNNLTVLPGANIVQQSLPLDPSGVVYDAVSRQPVKGAMVNITGPPSFNPATDLVGGSANVSQTTGSDGYYQYLLLATAPAGVYVLTVTSPTGYLPTPSTLIPACTPTLMVVAAPNPALVQTSNTPPSTGAPLEPAASCPATSAGLAATAGTAQYYYKFNFTPASANVVNNHIPVDPVLSGAIVMTKTTPLINVTRGDLVPYTITATNTLTAALSNIDIDDRIPPGFRYRNGSSVVDNVRLEPTVSARDLIWHHLSFAPGERKTFRLLLVVGAGVGETEYVNQAWALNDLVGTLVSNIASATVRVIPDPTFDCSDIIGKVFDDKNANGYQDQGEPGIPNVRVVTTRGLLINTDAEGRFHVACADIPQEDIGSNFVMKLDERTLPSGYRLTTENPQSVRVTRGKVVKLEFGATIHHVVRLDLRGDAFVADSTELLPQWQQQLAVLPARLRDRPSVLRIAYARGSESAVLAQRRLKAVAARIRELWQQDGDKHQDHATHYPLAVETELDGTP